MFSDVQLWHLASVALWARVAVFRIDWSLAAASLQELRRRGHMLPVHARAMATCELHALLDYTQLREVRTADYDHWLANVCWVIIDELEARHPDKVAARTGVPWQREGF